MPDQEPEYQDIKIVAAVSVPMCGWNPHWGCLTEAIRPFKIPIRLAYGAFWHQSMSNLLEDALADGIDWVLTLDYDSMFDAEQLDRLIGVFGQNQHIDALAALQCKRSTDEVPLMGVTGVDVVEVTDEPIKADTAHFGMTLIRMDALKRVPMPWFRSVPDEKGSYKTLQRCDADIYFWHQWKNAGNTLYVDPLCSIGHLQPMVSEFDEHYKPRHIQTVDWRQKHARRA